MSGTLRALANMLLILFGVGLVGACGQARRQDGTAPVPAIRVLGDAGVWAFHNPAQVSWLDEDTLVFAGAPKGPEVTLRPSHVYVWKMGDRPRIHADDRWAGGEGYVCASGGQIAFSPQTANEMTTRPVRVFRGALGHEVQQVLADPARDPALWTSQQANYAVLGSRAVSGKACDYPTEPDLAGREWVANQGRSAILDFGPRGQAFKAIGLLAKGQGGRLAPVARIDLDRSQAEPFCTDTPAWDHSFLVWNCYQGSWDGPALTLHRISAQGVQSAVTVQTRREIWGGAIVPFRDGYLVVVNADGDSKAGGLYLLKGQRPERLMPGAFAPAAVSPSGCRIALFVYEPPRSASDIKIIQLCNARSAQ